MADFEKIRKEAAKLETLANTSQDKVDTVNETLQAIKKGKTAALEDILIDIEKAYTSGTERTPEEQRRIDRELTSVKVMLDRLESSYIEATKEGIYLYSDAADKYFEELTTITGSEGVKEVDFSTLDPDKFWLRNRAGWYERAEHSKEVGTFSFKEKSVEEEIARGWQDQIYKFADEKNRITDPEKFQEWIDENQENLRRLILKQVGDRMYIVDFTNLSKNFKGALSDKYSNASFIARHIGLADLFSDITNALTVWKGNKLYTGKLDKDYSRKNGLKGAYIHGKKRYLDIWHGAVISTHPKHQIIEAGDKELEGTWFEEPKEPELKPDAEEEPTTGTTTIQQVINGEQVLEIEYKAPKLTLDTAPKRQAKIIESTTENRRRTLEGIKPEERIKEFTNKFSAAYEYIEGKPPHEIKIDGKLSFNLENDPATIDYTQIDAELIYLPEADRYKNIEIAIPFNKENSYLLKVKKPTNPPTVAIYEFDNLDDLKEKLTEAVRFQDDTPEDSRFVENYDVTRVELDKSCSDETVDKYIRDNTIYGSTDKTIVVETAIPGTTVERLAESTESHIKLKGKIFTAESVEALPLNDKIEVIELEYDRITPEGLEALFKVANKAKEVRITHSKLASNPDKNCLFVLAKHLNKTLTDLDLSSTAFDPHELKHLRSCKKLKKLNLSHTPTDKYAKENYLPKIVNVANPNLEETPASRD